MGQTNSSPAVSFRSLRHFLRTFSAAVILPGLVLTLIVAWLWGKHVIDEREDESRRLAAHAAEGMANHLGTMTASLAVLSRLPLDEEHFASFHDVAKDFSEKVGYHVTLAKPDGHQFLSTRLPFGTQPPQRSSLESVQRAVESGKANVSDLFPGKMAQNFVITVDAPVQTPDGMRIVTLSSDAQAIADVLYRTNVPEGWLLGLIDGQGRFIASGRDPGKWTGKPAAPAVLEASRMADSGMIRNISVEGFPIVSIFHRVPGTDWRVLIGIPEAVLYDRLYLPLGIMVGTIVLVMGLTLLLAFFFTRQLDGAAQKLMKIVHDPLAEVPGPVKANSIDEFEEVSRVIRDVAGKREQLAKALDMSVSIIRDMEGRIIHWTAGCEALYGWPASAAIGKNTHELFETTFPEPLRQIETALVQQGEWVGELEHTLKDGRRIRVSAQWIMYSMEGGRLPVVVETIHDLSAETRLEMALRESEIRFRAAFEQAAVGMAHMGMDGRFLRVNQKLCEILGYDRESLLRMTYRDVTHPDDLPKDAAGGNGVRAGFIPSYSTEKRYLRPDGSMVWANVTLSLAHNPDGQPDYVIGVVEDIQRRKEMELALDTERKMHQQSLERQVARRTSELLVANKELEGFVFAASHDLRAPLGRINSFGELLERHCRDRLEEDALLYLGIIRSNTLRLIALVDDLLAHAQVSQQIQSVEPVPMEKAVQGILDERGEDVREKGAEVRLSLPEGCSVLANQIGLAQVLRNLVENSLKYSAPAARPVIEIGGQQQGDLWRVWVRDNGIGFDMAYHDRIFEIFRRLHTYQEYPGSGIGLALARKAMDHMGGRIWAESSPGQGATFYLELPAAGAEPNA